MTGGNTYPRAVQLEALSGGLECLEHLWCRERDLRREPNPIQKPVCPADTVHSWNRAGNRFTAREPAPPAGRAYSRVPRIPGLTARRTGVRFRLAYDGDVILMPGKQTLDEIAATVYGEMRRLARHYLSDQRANHTLQPTALVHEAYIRLEQQGVTWQNRAHFIAIAATMMRRVLLNYARSRKAAKRDSGLQVESTLDSGGSYQIEILDLERAMQSLKRLDAQQEKIVELRFFGGLSVDETAEVLGIGSATVKRNWATARLWLTKQLQTPGQQSSV